MIKNDTYIFHSPSMTCHSYWNFSDGASILYTPSPPPSCSFLPVIFLIIVYFCSFLSGVSYGFSEYLKAEIDVGEGSFVGDPMRNNVIIFSSSTF